MNGNTARWASFLREQEAESKGKFFTLQVEVQLNRGLISLEE